MHRILSTTLAVWILSCAFHFQLQAEAQGASPASNVSARPALLAADYFGNRVLILDRDGVILWSHDADRPLDVWQVSRGDVLFCSKTGVRQVRPDMTFLTRRAKDPSAKDQTRVVWEYKVEPPNETHGVQPLPECRVLVGLSAQQPALLELDARGAQVRRIPIRSNQTQIHSQMRCIRITPRGTYLVAQNKEEVVREYDFQGNVLREIRLAGCNPFLAVSLANGNLLVAGGDGHRFLEIDSRDRIVWQVGRDDLPGCPLWFAAGAQRLPNGNTLLCNYAAGGHGKAGTQPQVVEVTPDKRIVWTLSAYPRIQAITAVQSLDVEGDPARGEIAK